jgi:UDP-N-acetyl-D-galactosamine dehydrogenase
MGPFVAQKLVKLLIDADITVKGARVGVLGLTFKEDCNDLRNSKVPDIVTELRQFGIERDGARPARERPEALHEYGLKLAPLDEMSRSSTPWCSRSATSGTSTWASPPPRR